MREREERRVKKYKAKIDTSATKLTQIASHATELKLAGGQITGKFMSLNEPAIKELA